MKFSKLADSQSIKMRPLNTRAALRLVAYWRFLAHGDESWRPVVRTILAQAPERKRITSRLIASDLLLKMIYGETKTRPPVTAAVAATVFAYTSRIAAMLDASGALKTIPTITTKEKDGMVEKMLTALKVPAPKAVSAALVLLLLLALSRK